MCVRWYAAYPLSTIDKSGANTAAITSLRVDSGPPSEMREPEPQPLRRRPLLDPVPHARASHSTVTLLARFRGLSTSVPRAQAV